VHIQKAVPTINYQADSKFQLSKLQIKDNNSTQLASLQEMKEVGPLCNWLHTGRCWTGMFSRSRYHLFFHLWVLHSFTPYSKVTCSKYAFHHRLLVSTRMTTRTMDLMQMSYYF